MSESNDLISSASCVYRYESGKIAKWCFQVDLKSIDISKLLKSTCMGVYIEPKNLEQAIQA